MDNEIQLARCEAEREYEASEDSDNPEYLIQETDEYWENQYDAHKEQCGGCALCTI